MNRLSKRTIYIFAGIILGLALVVFFVFKATPRNTPETTGTDTSTQPAEETGTTSATSDANPEERNPLLKKAALPHENNQYAIAYRPDSSAPFGVTLIIIDKTSSSGVSPAIRSDALNYLAVRGVNPGSIKIEYRGLNDAR